MSLVSNRKFIYYLADEQNRTYYYEAGVVKKSSLPTRIKTNPDGWKDITFQWATNQKYFSTIRSFTTAIKFVKDGQSIIADRMLNGAGTEEKIYLIILRSDHTLGLNGYKLEYKGRLDFSKFNGDLRTGIGMNTLQDDVFSLVQANESAVYSIQCNASNQVAVRTLFDGTLLQDKFNYQIVKLDEYHSDTSVMYALPLAFLNNEGDNVGITNNSPNYESLESESVDTYVADPANQNYIMKSVDPIVVTIKGTFSFIPHSVTNPHYAMTVFFMRSSDTFAPLPANQVVFDNGNGGQPGWPFFPFTNGQLYTFNINCTISLAAGERLFFMFRAFSPIGDPGFVEGISTNISIYFASKADPTTAYGLRPLDVLKQLVSQITNGKFTADSKFLATNNRKLLFSGSSLRNFPDAVCQITFSDFFKAYSVAYNLGITVRNGVLFMEPLEDIYNGDTEILRLPNVSKVSVTVAQEYIYTSAKVGYQKQTYNKRNGRYEYNCTHNYKFPIYTVLNQLDLVSPIRADSFGAEFIRTGYPNLNSTDDKGDADLWTIMVSDSVGSAEGEISTAVAFSVETLILATPVIKSPFTNSVIYFANPTISGISQPNMLITIFVDGEIDGTTNADSAGNWSYEIQGALQSLSDTSNGVHTVAATAQTDPSNISSISNILTLIINTQVQSPFYITSPSNNDSLFNNLPVISGIAPPGSVVSIHIDVTLITTVIANTSGLWSYQVTAAIADGLRIINVTSPGLPSPAPVVIAVNKNVAQPLITSIQYNDIIYNNLPLIKGVAIPTTVVSVYLDGGGGAIVGGIAGPMGTAVADANGDWSFQVVNVTDSSGNVTPYIPEGLHIVSTTPEPINVAASISGYRLMRGTNGGPVADFDAIKLDDQYIPPGVDPAALPPTIGQFLHPETLYNIIDTTPLRILRNHDNILNGFLSQQTGAQIVFNGAEINPNLVTKKNGIVFNEGANVNVSELGPKLFIPYYLNFTTPVVDTFNDLMQSLNNDGYITVIVKDVPIYCLPLGSMNMKPATNEAQTWKLLISGRTSFSALLQIFGNGLPIKLDKGMIYLSDLNPLHFVEYNFTPEAGYHFADIYQDWQKNRFKTWPLANPDYYQPVQRSSDKIPLQLISNGTGEVQVQVFSITTGALVDTIIFSPVAGSTVQLPNVLQELTIDPSIYPEGQYWFAAFTGGAIFAVSEKVWIKEDFPDTFLFKYGGSSEELDYFFSSGIQPMIRVQAQFLLIDEDAEVDNYESEAGDWQITRGIALESKVLQLGNQNKLISDWMYRKMNQILLLDNLFIEGQHYTRNNNSKLEKVDLGSKGVPEILATIQLSLAENQRGRNFTTPGDDGNQTVVYTLDARAFGQNAGVLNVTEENT